MQIAASFQRRFETAKGCSLTNELREMTGHLLHRNSQEDSPWIGCGPKRARPATRVAPNRMIARIKAQIEIEGEEKTALSGEFSRLFTVNPATEWSRPLSLASTA